jgi:hypothetical protein
MRALAIGGIEDHVHELLSMPPTIAVAKAMQLVKGGSSKWMNDQLPQRSFAWQENYGAFTIGVSQIKDTVRYINNQKEHHAKRGFDEEFMTFFTGMALHRSRGDPADVALEIHTSCSRDAPAGQVPHPSADTTQPSLRDSSLLLRYPPLKRRAIFIGPSGATLSRCRRSSQ